MTPAGYTEDTLVQQTTAEYLEQQLGWRSVYAYNNETFVSNPHPQPLSQGEKGVVAETRDHSEICLGRGSDREIVLTEILRQKLADLNKGLPDAAYDDAVTGQTSFHGATSQIQPRRKKTFSLPDWMHVCKQTSLALKERGLTELAQWLESLSKNSSPRKNDQDRVDSCICLLVALYLAERRECLMVGNMQTGYIITLRGGSLLTELQA